MYKNIKRKITAGPPSNEAFPTIAKIPAPMIAATPIKVKSVTPSVLRNPLLLCSASLRPAAASAWIRSIDFLRNIELLIVFKVTPDRLFWSLESEFWN
jgi:hypothetical protein